MKLLTYQLANLIKSVSFMKTFEKIKIIYNIYPTKIYDNSNKKSD